MANEVSTSEKLQKENIDNLWKVICMDFVIFNIISSSIDSQNFLNYIFSKNLLENSLFKILTSLFIGLLIVKIFLNIIPADIKHIIVYGRLKYSLPGHRAFTEHVNKDPRIDVKNLEKNLGSFPTLPAEQNQLWYRLYQKYKNDEQIIESHVKFLFFRDGSILTIFILIAFIVLNLIFKATIFQWSSTILFILFQLTIFIITARNNGNRFVRNVLCQESHQEK
jgi:hypothetical protein